MGVPNDQQSVEDVTYEQSNGMAAKAVIIRALLVVG
jgi:hypothetical protein